MERRTNGQILDAVRDILDEASTPYFSDAQIVSVFNAEYADWLSDSARIAERDEKKRRDLSPLIMRVTPTVSQGGVVDLNSLTVGLFRMLSVSADYTDCNSERPVKPVSWDAYQTAKRDPFNAPTSREPAYLEIGETVHIVPPPRSVNLVYIKRPVPLSETEDDRIEVGYEVQTRLIERTAKKLAIPQFNSEVYQTLTAEGAGKEN